MKSISTILLFVTLLFFSNINFVNAQHYMAKGKLVNKQMQPVDFATASLLKNDSLIAQTYTDSLGIFHIKAESEKYTLLIESFGQEIFNKTIDLNQNIDLGIIKVEDAILLDELIISLGHQLKLKKGLGKYTIQNISKSPFTKNKTVSDFIKYVPIINYENNGSVLNILNKGTATIFINGKKIEDNMVAMSMLKSLPASTVKEIEIITNPDSRFEASNNNGIINIITYRNENEGFRGAVNTTVSQSFYNSQNTNAFLSYSKNKISVTTSLTLDDAKSYANSNYNYKNFITNTQTDIESKSIGNNQNVIANLNLNYDITNKQRLGVQFYTRQHRIKNNFNTTNSYRQIGEAILDSVYISDINQSSPGFLGTYRGNLNYNLRIDEEGSNLDIDLNQYVNNNNVNTYNVFNDFSGGNIIEKANFLQNPDIKTRIGNYKISYTNFFNDGDDKLDVGLHYTHSNVTNYFFFGNYNGILYVPDRLQTNNFKYTDHIFASFINYEKVFSEKWEGKLGLRLENFEANGKTDTGNEQLALKSTCLFPSLSLLFTPNDNNEFSFDFSSHILRPTFNNLNPFVSYTSPNSFRVNNPLLKPILSYEFLFSYSFYDNYMLDIGLDINRNLFNEFDVVLADNWIKTTTANYGNSNDFYVSFVYTNNFFKDSWNFSAQLNYAYDKTAGSFENVDMSFTNNRYSFKIKNQIMLNEKQDFSLGINYGFTSSNRMVSGKINSLHSLDMSLSKDYKNFNFSIGAYDLARADLKISETKTDYSFYKEIKYYKTVYLNINYNFGNKKIKKVNEKQDKDINNRLL